MTTLEFFDFTVATLNVENLIAPNRTYYAKPDGTGGQELSRPAFDRKVGWIADRLADIDADVVALQEVFDDDSLIAVNAAYETRLTARFGNPEAVARRRYAHVIHVPNADARPDAPLPGVAFLSRFPVIEQRHLQTLDPPIVLDARGSTFTLARLSRPLGAIRVDLGKPSVSVWCLNAHLKSKRADHGTDTAADDAAQARFLARATGAARSLLTRTAEALAIRRTLLGLLEPPPGWPADRPTDHPVILLGDLNDTGDAVTTEIMRGETPFRGWDRNDPARPLKNRYWRVEMHAALVTHARRSERVPFYSHIYNGRFSQIDHIFHSEHFHFRAARRIGTMDYARCLTDHLVDDSQINAPTAPAGAGDHGIVVARYSIPLPPAPLPA